VLRTDVSVKRAFDLVIGAEDMNAAAGVAQPGRADSNSKLSVTIQRTSIQEHTVFFKHER
jgi:hypothetical protein